MIFAAIAIHFVLSFLNYHIHKSAFHPVFLFTAIWGVAISVLALVGDFFYELSETSLVVFCFGALFITLGALIGKMMIGRGHPSRHYLVVSAYADYRKILNFSLILLIIVFPFYIQRITELSALSGIDEFWKGLRLQTSSGAVDEEGLGAFSYFGAFANFAALVACNEYLNGRYDRKKAIFFIILVFIYGLISTARTGILTLLLATISIFFINKRISLFGISVGAFGFLLMFVLPAIFLEKGGSIDSSIEENISSLFENLKIYALAGIVAFSEVTKNLSLAPESNGIFAFFISLARALGLNVDFKSPVLAYVSTPWPTNVYTIYLQYYVQFGFQGVVVIMTLIGAVVSIFYELASRKIAPFIVLNSLATAFLIISVFSESFFTALSYWIQLFIFLFLFYRVLPFIRFRHRKIAK